MKLMKRLISLLVLALSACSPVQAEPRGCVILLHGLARSDTSMLVMQEALKQADYVVVAESYPSTQANITELAEQTLPKARRACSAQAPDQDIHVVTHSMGGILMRVWAEAHPDVTWGRVVMLAPPNQGSELVDAFEDIPAFEWFNGPAGIALGTGRDDVPAQLGPVRFSLGVIAGNRSLNAFYSSILPGEDDGKVTVDSTKVAGMKAHLTLPVTHTFLMNNPRVIFQTLSYLQDETFVPDLTLGEVLVEALLP